MDYFVIDQNLGCIQSFTDRPDLRLTLRNRSKIVHIQCTCVCREPVVPSLKRTDRKYMTCIINVFNIYISNFKKVPERERLTIKRGVFWVCFFFRAMRVANLHS